MRAYMLEFTGAIFIYAAMVGLSVFLFTHYGYEGLWVSVLPVPATFLVASAVLRNIRRMDEMQKQIMAESIGMAFVLTALITFNYGFLESAGFPRQSAFWVWGIMGLSWAVSQVIVMRRYR